MKNNEIISKETDSKLIKINLRKGNLSIDNDSYLDRVSEVHCRSCNKRVSRKDSIELEKTWGYICNNCQTTVKSLSETSVLKKEEMSSSDRCNRAGSGKMANTATRGHNFK